MNEEATEKADSVYTKIAEECEQEWLNVFREAIDAIAPLGGTQGDKNHGLGEHKGDSGRGTARCVTECPRCLSKRDKVFVHGHYQCPDCKRCIEGCCEGEVAL